MMLASWKVDSFHYLEHKLTTKRGEITQWLGLRQPLLSDDAAHAQAVQRAVRKRRVVACIEDADAGTAEEKPQFGEQAH